MENKFKPASSGPAKSDPPQDQPKPEMTDKRKSEITSHYMHATTDGRRSILEHFKAHAPDEFPFVEALSIKAAGANN